MNCKIHLYPKFYKHIEISELLDQKLWIPLFNFDLLAPVVSKLFIHKRGNFVYHHWGSPLSYPLRSLHLFIDI